MDNKEEIRQLFDFYVPGIEVDNRMCSDLIFEEPDFDLLNDQFHSLTSHEKSNLVTIFFHLGLLDE